ncbi:MAG: amidohydrolase family protein [Actinomycetota bacterium]|nr:amidohydrolase family protein [Actinomycetota bacterium]
MADVVIRNAVLHNGRKSAPIEDAVLVTHRGVIAYAGPARGAPPTTAADRVIDAGGGALLPGLIDCHVHVCVDGGPDFMAEAGVPEEEGVARGVRNARRTLDAGITTVRDLGGTGRASIIVSGQQRRGVIEGSRILTAGNVLTVRGGHAHYIGRQADTAEELVAEIRHLHDEGAEVVKIVATGGVLTEGVDATSAKYSEEQLHAAVDAAHALGMRVAAHAIGLDGIVAALRGGVDSVEHGCYLNEEAIGLLRDGSSYLVATLSAPTRILDGGDAVPEYARAKSLEVIKAHRASFRAAAEAGARMASGTDAGTPFNLHGGLAGELALMHDNGLPLDRVLISATSAAADLLGLNDAGVLEEGRRADAVVLDGDPLSSVDAYTKVSVVVQAGVVVRA